MTDRIVTMSESELDRMISADREEVRDQFDGVVGTMQFTLGALEYEVASHGGDSDHWMAALCRRIRSSLREIGREPK